MKRIVLVVAAILLCANLSAQDFQILVLDGRNGRAVPDEMLNVWLHESPEEGKFISQRHVIRQLLLPTDRTGTIKLHVQPDERFVTLSTDYYLDCRVMKTKKIPPGFPPACSVAEMVKSGVVTENGCGEYKGMPTTGQLVFFVRPWHWWERLLHPP